MLALGSLVRRVPIVFVLLALLVLAPAALARDRSDELLVDACADEHVDGHYTQEDYRKALDKIPSDQDEYTGCRDVVRQAKLAAAASRRPNQGSSGGTGSAGGGGAGGGTSGRGGSTAAPGRDPLKDATPAERKAVAAAGKVAKPVELGDGLVVRPGLASASATLPTSLIVALALLGAAALAAAGWLFYARVLARRTG